LAAEARLQALLGGHQRQRRWRRRRRQWRRH
jgi:hypothetical protein